MSTANVRTLAALMIAAVALTGCASADVKPTKRASGNLPKPDMIIVNDFAVSPEDVKLDGGAMASVARDASSATPTEEEIKVGRMVADRLAVKLVEELRKSGINAARAGGVAQPSETTAVINGQFITVDQGNQSARTWVGFGLGGSQLRTRLQISQGGQLVAASETATKSSLKPGMLVSIASGSGAAVAVGAAGTVANETLLATVEADAARTAAEVAKRIKKAYVDRGWMAK
jgi:hypothetical protein